MKDKPFNLSTEGQMPYTAEEHSSLALLYLLFQQLRRRKFPLGLDDYVALQQALRAGFGLSSHEELRSLCCSLWAKSRQEQETLIALFDQLRFPKWDVSVPKQTSSPLHDTESEKRNLDLPKAESGLSPQTQPYNGLPAITIDSTKLSKRSFIFLPQFPLTYREIAQAWRRLRRPVREGPPVELDLEATIALRSRSGIVSPVVLKPLRRNRSRVLLLIDRQGSMAPFHHFTEEFCHAIEQAGRLEQVSIYYFHDTPAEGADDSILDTLDDQLFPSLDTILPQLLPLQEGYVYEDPDLFSPVPIVEALQNHAFDASVVLVSDGGAARKKYDTLRLLDTLSFFRALRNYTTHYVWLNPLPGRYWQDSTNTASQIARHIPMFSLNYEELYKAVNVLRGHPYTIERPL